MRPFQVTFESLGHYHDFWATVIFGAPDNFQRPWISEPIDQHQALLDSFETLRNGFHFVEKKVKDERLLRILKELIQMSFEAYSNGDKKRGTFALQECEGMIWPSQAVRLELAPEAERRAFGTVVTFAHVKPRTFGGEGSFSDLGPAQRELFEAAHARAVGVLRGDGTRTTYYYVVDTSGTVSEIKQPSEKKCKAEIARLVNVGQIVAFSRTEIVFLGVIVHDLEERRQPQLSARALIKDGAIQSYRFFLDDPTLFPVEAADA